MLDSCKFQGFVAKFSRHLPLSGRGSGVCSPSLVVPQPGCPCGRAPVGVGLTLFSSASRLYLSCLCQRRTSLGSATPSAPFPYDFQTIQ